MIELPDQMEIERGSTGQPDRFGRLWRLVSRPFIAPRLPWVLVVLLLLIIATDISFSLIDQPLDYWRGYPVAYTGLQSLLSLGPVLSILLALIYLIVVVLVLRLFTRPVAFVLWMILYFYHFRGALRTAECGLPGFFQLEGGACEIAGTLLPILLTALIGLVLVRLLFSAGKLVEEEPRFPLKAAVFSTLWSLVLVVGLVSAVRLPTRGWVPIFTDYRPPPQTDGAMVFDSNRGVVVLFGGRTQSEDGQVREFDNQTWEWDGANWTRYVSQSGPTPRRVPGMAYDKARGVVVLFGGEGGGGPLDDTWEWDGEQWRMLTPTTRPPARCCHRLFFDETRGKVVVYGGYSGSSGAPRFFNDGWEWDGVNWQPIFFDTVSPPASNFDIVHASGRDRNITLLSDFNTWAWEGESWTRISLAEDVPRRLSFRMAYTPVEGQVVMFGGFDDTLYMDDTWLFDGERWNELDVSRPPAGRWGHLMVFDDVRGRILLFGGYDGTNYRNDMWELVIDEESVVSSR